jgi:predicted RNase H-like HicB family nuclease
MSKTFKYRIVTEWSDEDDTFIARVPALPGCAAHGKTPEAAAKEAREAAETILETMHERHSAIPPEDAATDYSGQLRLRLPKSLHERISQMSTAEGVSINTMLLTLIAEAFGRRSEKPAQAAPGVKRAGSKRKAVA